MLAVPPLVLSAVVGVAGAAGPNDGRTPTGTLPPVLTVAPTTTASAPSPPPPASPPPPPDAADEGPPSEEPPGPDVRAPAPVVAPPSPEQDRVQQLIAETLERARQALVAAVSVEAATMQHVVGLRQQLAVSERELGERREQERAAGADLVAARKRLRQWAVDVYTGGGLRQTQYVFEAEDLNDVPRRIGLAGGALGAADSSIRQEKVALAEVRDAVAWLEEVVEATRRRLGTAVEAASGATARADVARREVVALTAGADIVPHGMAFPVFGPTRFADTFGAPRMAGTRFAHAHQGVDIFAGPGMPVRAFERGVLARVGTDLLGGIKLWLVGQSGTQYYYAHLQGYAPGVVSGRAVDAGDMIAFVGNTGNAIRTPSHLHFEIHPHGGPAVNPYPILTQMLTVTGMTAPPAPAPPLASAPSAPASPSPPARTKEVHR